MIAPINGVEATDIRTLYVSAEEFDTIPEEGSYIYELWMSHSKENSQERIENTLHQLGIGPYHKPSILTSNNTEKREWSELIKGEITYDQDADVIVGILDSGVNNAHELLKPALPDERMDVAIGVLEATDKTDHGTGMAGLALLGDLAEMDKIVVFPGQGWWKERKLDNVDNSVPYSLIVSIETKETDIYNAVETAISNRIGVPIAQEV